MAQLKDTIIQGSARVTDTLYTTTMQAQIYQALTASNATTYGPGNNGQILTSNGSLTYWATNFAGNAASATIADRLRGFASSGTSNVSWGNQTGTQVCWANDSSGGSYSFRRDNPSSGKLSLEVDGRFYGNEGTNPAMLMNSDETYWGMGDPDAKANVWIRTTSSGILPNQAGGATSGHAGLGTSSWYFSYAYIQDIYAGRSIGVANTSATTGYGISLHNGPATGAPTYGIMFAGTGTFGTHGGVTSDWATYFTMNDTTNRGWIFRRGSTNVASIDGNGKLYLGYANSSANPGIYWNPYVESASDRSDVSAIYQIKSGVAGGTELRISQANDVTDVINLVTPQHIYLNSKKAFTVNDAWLRINESGGFSNGTYFGNTVVRTDGQLQVGSAGANFYANNSGNGYFSNTLGIGGTNTAYKLYVSGTSNINDIKYYSHSANAGKTYIGWIKIASIDLNTSNHFGNHVLDIVLSRTYNSPSSEVYYIRMSVGWGNVHLVQLSGRAGNRIIEKFRVVQNSDTHKIYLEYYVNTSYSNYQNTVNIKFISYHNAALTLLNEVQTEAETTFAGKWELTTAADGMVSNLTGNLTGNANTATEFSSNATVTLTGDTTGTSNGSKKSWSVATTTKNVTPTDASSTDLNTLTNLTTAYYYAGGSNTATNGPVTTGNAFGLHMFRTAAGYVRQEFAANGGDKYYRTYGSNAWSDWVKYLSSANYTSYTVKKDGTGASGSWGISISGNAATATKLSNTPNNTTTFLRGDNTWSNTLTGAFYSTDLFVQKTRLNDNWLGFYSANNGSGNRLGYIQGSTDYMYFRKEQTNNGFNFNGNLVPEATGTRQVGTSDLRWKFYGSYLNISGESLFTGAAIFNSTVTMNSSASIDSLTAGSLVVSGNSSLVNTANTATLLPHANNTYDVGSSSLKYANIYATKFNGEVTNVTTTVDTTNSLYLVGVTSSATTTLKRDTSITMTGNTMNLYTLWGTQMTMRHIDAGRNVVNGDHALYIGYGASTYTAKTTFWYSTGTTDSTSSRTQFAEINSNGLYALTRFGVAGQNTSYNFYVNGTSYLNGTITGHSTAGTTTSDVTGAVLLFPAINPNTGIFNGNGDGPGNWDNVANLIIKSWYGVGFVDGCTNNGMTVGIDCRTGNIRMNGSLYLGKPVTSGTGIYWNSYIESATDGSDASAIYQIINGVAGGTELRISQTNDNNDVINLVSPCYIYLNSKRAFNISDSWLRINEDSGFSSGVYFGGGGGGVVRTDNQFQIGDNGARFYANSNGDGKFSRDLVVGRHLTVTSTGASWIDGQRYTCAIRMSDATNTGAYWPWIAQTNTGSSKWFSFGTLGTAFYWIGSTTSRTDNSYDYGMSFNVSNGYLQGATRVYSAVWNDYAEMRNVPIAQADGWKDDNSKKPNPLAGKCVREVGDDTMVLSNARMQPGCKIISDTFGFSIGETKDCNTPIAVSGRALVYIYEGREVARKAIGRPICSGPDGTVSIMTDAEYREKGYCCVGTISAVPDYEVWGTGEVQVNGRIWIYVK